MRLEIDTSAESIAKMQEFCWMGREEGVTGSRLVGNPNNNSAEQLLMVGLFPAQEHARRLVPATLAEGAALRADLVYLTELLVPGEVIPDRGWLRWGIEEEALSRGLPLHVIVLSTDGIGYQAGLKTWLGISPQTALRELQAGIRTEYLSLPGLC